MQWREVGGAAPGCCSASWEDAKNGVPAPLRHDFVAFGVPRCGDKNAKHILECG
jgi:hypothetical protein